MTAGSDCSIWSMATADTVAELSTLIPRTRASSFAIKHPAIRPACVPPVEVATTIASGRMDCLTIS